MPQRRRRADIFCKTKWPPSTTIESPPPRCGEGITAGGGKRKRTAAAPDHQSVGLKLLHIYYNYDIIKKEQELEKKKKRDC